MRAIFCAAAISLAALAQACVQSPPAAPGGGAAASPEAQTTPARPSPVQTAQPTPAASSAVESPLLPPPAGFVSDFAKVIDDKTEGPLEARLSLLKERGRVEFAVVTVETTDGRDIKDYSLAVARQWGVGPPAGGPGGGLLLLVAVKDRRWWMQVSRGLEADLPDDVVKQIGDRMVPLLREGRFGDAVTEFAEEIIQRLAERRGFSMKG